MRRIPPITPPCWNQSISGRYDGGTPEWCAPRMRATSTARSWYWPPPTRPGHTLRLKTRKKKTKEARVSNEPRMGERSVSNQPDMNPALNWELRAVSFSSKPHRAESGATGRLPPPAASGGERAGWRSLRGLTDHARNSGLASYARNTTGDLVRQQRAQVTDSRSLTRLHFLRPFGHAPPTR